MAFLGIGAAIFGVGFFAAVTDFAITAAASIGLSYAAQALAGKPAAPEAAHFSAQISEQAGGTVPRCFPMGKTATKGQTVYFNTWGFDGQTPNAYYTRVSKLSDLPIKALLGVWVSGAKCTLGTVAHSDYGFPVTEYNKDGADHLWVKFYDGTQTAADPFLVAKVSSSERPYENTRVGLGCAYAIMTALVEDTLFTNSVPSILYQVDGVRLYDPTRDSTNGGDGPQRFTDPSTWGGDGDDYPAVQKYNVLRGFRYQGQWLYGLQRTTQASLPNVNWNAQIGKCRAAILGPDGMEPTYLSGGFVSVDQPPADLLDALATACHGKISEVGGFYKVHLGEPDNPTFAFTDGDCLTDEIQTFNPFLSLADSVNGITGTFTDPAQGWTDNSPAPLYNATYEAVDGNRRLLANPSFGLVYRPSQVQRLMQSALSAARRERSHSVFLPPVFWLVEPGDVGQWTSPRNGYVNKLFEVTSVIDKSNSNAGLSLQEVDPSDYHPPAEYAVPTVGPTSFVRPAAQGVVDWSVAPSTVRDGNGIDRRPAILLSWDADMPGVVGIRWRVRRVGETDLVTADYFNLPGVSQINITQSLLPLTAYEVSVQYIPSAPRDMTWSEWRAVTTPDVSLQLVDLEQSIVYNITTLQDQLVDKIAQVENLIASVGANLIMGSRIIDQKEIRTQLDATYQANSAFIKNVQTVSVAADSAMASDITDILSNVGTTSSGKINQTAQSLSTLSGSLVSLSSTVSATFGAGISTSNTVQQAIATASGIAASATSAVDAKLGSGFSSASTVSTAVATALGYGAQVTVSTNVNGYVVGTKLINGGPGAGAFIVEADKFQIQLPGYNGSAPIPIFTTGTINGAAAVGISAATITLDGTVTARMMSVGTLAAVSAHFGNAVFDGVITSPNGKYIIDLNNGRDELWD